MNKVKSAIRALQILEQFGEMQQPLRLKDVAELLRYPISSTAALLKSLADYGYLSFDRNSRYYYTTGKLPELGARLTSTAIEEGALMDAMQALQQSTGELVVVGTPNDLYIDYIKALRSTQPVQLYTPAGTRRLMVQSGMGWLLMSRMDRIAALKIYRLSVTSRLIQASELSEKQLMDRVQKLRSENYVFTRGKDFVRSNPHFGGALVSMIVPTPANNRSLVLGVGGPVARLTKNRDKIVKHMRAEMARLAEKIEGNGASRPTSGRLKLAN
jgi:DNA-binding IclR family transcriptional regulator